MARCGCPDDSDSDGDCIDGPTLHQADSTYWKDHRDISDVHEGILRTLLRIRNNEQFAPTYELLATKHFELAWWHYIQMKKLQGHGPFQAEEEFIKFKNHVFRHVNWSDISFNIEKWYIRVPPFC
jgi:hypothetical protein